MKKLIITFPEGAIVPVEGMDTLCEKIEDEVTICWLVYRGRFSEAEVVRRGAIGTQRLVDEARAAGMHLELVEGE